MQQESNTTVTDGVKFQDFLFYKMTHLEKFYGTIEEFKTHLLSGEVTMPIKWLLEMVEEFHCTILPSLHQIGDKVKVFLMPEGKSEFPGFISNVLSVHFYEGKVKYDLEIKFAGEYATRIYNIDSMLVNTL